MSTVLLKRSFSRRYKSKLLQLESELLGVVENAPQLANMNAVVNCWSAVREAPRSLEEYALSSRNSDVKPAAVLDIVAANRNMRIVNVAVDQIAHNAG